MTTILAVIPAYNEAAHIVAIVSGVLQHLPVLVVDDGSTDQTALLAQDAGATVYRQHPNRGKGAALRAGFRQAIEGQYDDALTLDADGQHDPADIPRFVQAYATRQADLIVGARTFGEMPLTRRVANSLGQHAFSWAIGRPVRDNQSGYRLVSRRLMEATLASAEAGFEFEVEMIVTCIERQYVLEWVPIRTIYAGEESHIRPIPHLVGFLRMVWQTRRRISSKHPPS